MAGQLDDFATTTLDATGAGTVRLGPRNQRTTWQVRSVQVSTGTNVAEPVATLYLGTSSKLASTYTGSNDTASDLGVDLHPGQFLTVAWTGGDVGATATATVYGTTSTWGRT
jgi:hypothetical protein